MRRVLYSRPIASDSVPVELIFMRHHAPERIAHPETVWIALTAGMAGNPRAIRILPIHRHQVFGAGKDKDVGFLCVSVLRQSLVGLARDGGKREAPTEAERSVASARIIGQGKLWPEPRATWAGRNGHRHRSGAGDRIGCELLADATDCPAAFRKRDRRCHYLKGFFLRRQVGRCRLTATQRSLLLHRLHGRRNRARSVLWPLLM